MSSFDDILAQPLPSQRHLFESAEDEKKEEKDKEVDRQAIVDAIGEVLDDFEDIEADTDDFLSGDEDKIEIDDADDDFIKKLKSALKDYKEIEIEKDDDEVTISLKQESVEDFINSLDFFGESEEDNSDLSEDGEEDDMSEEGEDDNSADVAEGTDDMEELCKDDEQNKYHFMERHYGSFHREVTIPVNANAESICATYENGVLKVCIPKVEQPIHKKQIVVK